MSIRDNEIAASSMGVDVALYKSLALACQRGFTGVASSSARSRSQFVAPDGYTVTLAISLFLGLVVGGVGWLPGSLFGAAFILFVPNIAEHLQGPFGRRVRRDILARDLPVPNGARQLAFFSVSSSAS